jgi:hypothetical protein
VRRGSEWGHGSEHEGGRDLSHLDLRGKAGYVSYVRHKRTSHIMTKCIEINVTSIIINSGSLTKINENNKAN